MFRRRRNSASFAVSEPRGKSRGKERHALGSKGNGLVVHAALQSPVIDEATIKLSPSGRVD